MQKVANYQNEYDRIVDVLSQNMFPGNIPSAPLERMEKELVDPGAPPPSVEVDIVD